LGIRTNPQSPIPNPQSPIPILKYVIIIKLLFLLNKNIIILFIEKIN